jgi:hypothetical protein
MNGWAVCDAAHAVSSSDIAALAITDCPRAPGQALANACDSHISYVSAITVSCPLSYPTLSANRTQGHVIRKTPRVHHLRIIVFKHVWSRLVQYTQVYSPAPNISSVSLYHCLLPTDRLAHPGSNHSVLLLAPLYQKSLGFRGRGSPVRATDLHRQSRGPAWHPSIASRLTIAAASHMRVMVKRQKAKRSGYSLFDERNMESCLVTAR